MCEWLSDLTRDLTGRIWRAGLAIGYAGLADFYSGLEIGYSRLIVRADIPAVSDANTLDNMSLSLVMRYYF